MLFKGIAEEIDQNEVVAPRSVGVIFRAVVNLSVEIGQFDSGYGLVDGSFNLEVPSGNSGDIVEVRVRHKSSSSDDVIDRKKFSVNSRAFVTLAAHFQVGLGENVISVEVANNTGKPLNVALYRRVRIILP